MTPKLASGQTARLFGHFTLGYSTFGHSKPEYPGLGHPISHLLMIAAVCFLAITPFFFWGSPSGHDFEFHMFSWMDVLSQWKQGIVYPRWAAMAHWGYGEARFIFYPPASWTLGAALGVILPWKMVPGAYCWLVMTLAGAAMYRLAQHWLRPPDALFAAAFYAVNPYHLLIVYWRSAYAELLAAALVPLLLLCAVRLKEDGFRATLWLSLTLAAAWLTNVPAALMIQYSAAGLAVLVAVSERSLRPLVRTARATLLGVGLASFYLLPAIYEQRWINISQVLSPGVQPQDNFLFTTLADLDHNRFNLLVSFVALAEAGVLALAIWFSRRERIENRQPHGKQNAWVPLSAYGAVTIFLMFSASNLLWEYLPEFRFVQLPFRWLLCLNAPLAVLLAMATDRGPKYRRLMRGLVSAVLLATIVITARRTQLPWWDMASDIREMTQAVSDGTGYEGTDEYAPAGADPYELNKNLPRVSDETGTAVSATTIQWGATEKRFLAHTSAARNLTIRLFNYPAWEVTVDRKPVQTQTLDVTGLMIIPAAAGENDVRIHFGGTRDRLAGGIVSLVSMVAFAAAWIKARPHTMSSVAS